MPNNYNALLKDHLANVTQKNRGIILMGDFNIDYNVDNKKEFKLIINEFGFKQLVDKATRTTNISSTLIDLIITNFPDNISFVNVFQTSISDHDMVGCVRKVNHIKFPMQTVKCIKLCELQPWKYVRRH